MKKLALLAALIAAFGNTAYAQSTASASLTPFSFLLMDLDPDDGITPSITFTEVITEVRGLAADTFTGNSQSYSLPNGTGSASTAVSQASSSLTITDPSNASLNANGSAVSGALLHFGAYSAVAQTLGYFELSANTHVDFFVRASASAHTSAPFNGDNFENAFARARFLGYLFNPDNSEDLDTYNERKIEFDLFNFAENTDNNSPRSALDIVNLTFVNFSTETRRGIVIGEAIAAGYSYASPVPVPAAAWLFGSALMGFMGFKRRKAA